MEARVGHPGSHRQLARRFPVTVVVIVAFVITWSVWVPRALMSQGHLDSEWLTALGRYWTYGPAVAAVLAAWLVGGRAGLGELGSRLRRWRVGGRCYGVVLLGPAAFWVLVVAVHAALGWSESLGRPLLVEHGLAPAVPLLLYLALTDGLGEETGWRGYALLRQLERFGAVGGQSLARLGSGGLAPAAVLDRGHVPVRQLAVGPAAGAARRVGPIHLGFLHTWGSALLAILFHLCAISAGIAGDHWGSTVVVLARTWLLAGIVVASWRRRPARASARTARIPDPTGGRR